MNRFTLQASVLNLDLLLRSDIYVWLFTLFFKCGAVTVLNWTAKRTIPKTAHAARRHTEVNMEATEVGVHGFIHRLFVQKCHPEIHFTVPPLFTSIATVFHVCIHQVTPTSSVLWWMSIWNLIWLFRPRSHYKKQTYIWFNTTYESIKNLIWVTKIRFGPLLPAVWT